MVIIYGNERCGWCKKAKTLAKQYNIESEWRDTDNQDTLNKLKTMLPDVKTVPQIWWNGHYIGGYDNFASEIQNTLGGYGEQTF
jgi:glutaredoxin